MRCGFVQASRKVRRSFSDSGLPSGRANRSASACSAPGGKAGHAPIDPATAMRPGSETTIASASFADRVRSESGRT